MYARDMMSDGVMSLSADATVLEAAQLLVNCHVSAMPVVDTAGQMIGILSEADLLRCSAEGDDATDSFASAGSCQVVDVMTRDVVTADEDTPIAALAKLMTERRIKRVPILRERAVVGIVSRIDLLRALISLGSGGGREELPPSRDEHLRREVSAACQGRAWSLARQLDVVVNGGVAHLWGVVPSDLVRDAYRVAAENVPGIQAVEVHMHIVPLSVTRVGL
ncbi:MAG: CBS domain-containing protein [Enhydrobacter sp.]|nr:CBS domain-containing protein [Enhydrobacter sp.]